MVIERPDAFRALIQLAPFAGYHIGRHPAQSTADKLYEHYPRINIAPPFKNPAPHMVHYYDDPLQVTAGIAL